MQMSSTRWPNGRAKPKAWQIPQGRSVKTQLDGANTAVAPKSDSAGLQPAVLKVRSTQGNELTLNQLVELFRSLMQIEQPEKAAEKVTRLAAAYFGVVLPLGFLTGCSSSSQVNARAFNYVLACRWSQFSAGFSANHLSFADVSGERAKDLIVALVSESWSVSLSDEASLHKSSRGFHLKQAERDWVISDQLVQDLLKGVDAQTGLVMLKACLLAQAHEEAFVLKRSVLSELVLVIMLVTSQQILGM
jgi:hypothetical protein